MGSLSSKYKATKHSIVYLLINIPGTVFPPQTPHTIFPYPTNATIALPVLKGSPQNQCGISHLPSIQSDDHIRMFYKKYFEVLIAAPTKSKIRRKNFSIPAIMTNHSYYTKQAFLRYKIIVDQECILSVLHMYKMMSLYLHMLNRNDTSRTCCQ